MGVRSKEQLSVKTHVNILNSHHIMNSCDAVMCRKGTFMSFSSWNSSEDSFIVDERT